MNMAEFVKYGRSITWGGLLAALEVQIDNIHLLRLGLFSYCPLSRLEWVIFGKDKSITTGLIRYCTTKDFF
ncbi:hypothetical protein D3C87_1165920 [compost metagenome]